MSDDRASRISILEHELLEPVLLSYNLSLKFLRRFADFLGYSLSVAILGCYENDERDVVKSMILLIILEKVDIMNQNAIEFKDTHEFDILLRRLRMN